MAQRNEDERVETVLSSLELDYLADDIADVLADHDHPIHATSVDIRPHLPAFLAAVLGGTR